MFFTTDWRELARLFGRKVSATSNLSEVCSQAERWNGPQHPEGCSGGKLGVTVGQVQATFRGKEPCNLTEAAPG